MRNSFKGGLIGAVMLAGVAFVAAAPPVTQGGSFELKRFHHYPTGRWRQEMSGSRNGQPVGTPVVSSHCSGPLTASERASITQFANSMAPSCTTQVVTDQSNQAVIAQSCAIGAGQMVNHTTMTAINDHELTTDIESTAAGRQSETHIRSTYLGPCSAEEMAAARPAPGSPFGKIPAEQCRQLPKMRADMAGLDGQCAQLPGAYQGQCRARIAVSQQAFKVMETSCAGR